MFTMTFNEALRIQYAQMVFYRQSIGRKGIKAIKARTIYPVDIEPDVPMKVSEINKLVPRGCEFEYLTSYRPSEYDATSYDWHNAIRRGLNIQP